MFYFKIAGLVNFIVGVLCAYAVYIRNPRSEKVRHFVIYSLFIAVTYLLSFLWPYAGDGAWSLFHFRLILALIQLVPPIYFKHVQMMLDVDEPLNKIVLRASWAICILFAGLCFTPLFITGFAPRLDHIWGAPGPLVFLMGTTYPGISIYVFFLAGRLRVGASPIYRNKMAWLNFAVLFAILGVASNAPLYFNIDFPPSFLLFNVAVSLYLIMAASLFFNLGLTDIYIFFKDTIVHILSSFLIGSLFAAISYYFYQDLNSALLILFLALIFDPVYKRVFPSLRKLIDKTGLGGRQQYLSAITSTMEKIRETTYTYDDLARNIVTSLLNTFPIEMAAVYFYDITRNEMRLRAQKGMHNPAAADLLFNRGSLAIPIADPLIQFIGSSKEVVIGDVLQNKPDVTDAEKAVVSSMLRIEAEVCAPIILVGNVRGVLALSRKKDGQMFNEEDIKAVFAFARMSEEIMRYITGMETELNHMALYSHDMDNDTKSLVQTLQFLHSPMAKTQPPETLEKLIKQAEDVAARLNFTFKENRDRSSLIMKTIRGEYEKQPVDITKLVRTSCGKYVLQAQENQVGYEVTVQESPALVMGNSNDLIRIVDNLVGNALRYVDASGHIWVKAEATAESFQITVKDDGQGIDKENLDKIWKMGWQVKTSKKGSSGFGLAIAQQIVHLHQGTVQVDSEGLGKGTTFTVKIPLIKSQPNGSNESSSQTTVSQVDPGSNSKN